MSETQTPGLLGPNRPFTTALPRLGLIRCRAARVPMKTHSHQVLPLTRAEVSSEHTTGLASTTFTMACAAPCRGSRARDRMSLIDGPNISPISRASRSMPMAWA